ncbi:hypothetical protein L6164_001400 [Bauhinia variegata]|uniref:Uncharacterized protein n=1 Tax=Bauhinia variegata TaxID=167791 RepID=A0ACB9QBM6_BAUVA|nr:hypothetical protein L6164_001400 [Bauhinia variegata]
MAVFYGKHFEVLPKVIHGPIVDEVRQKFDSWIYQVVRLCANSREAVSSPVEHLDSGQTKGQNGTGLGT